MNDFGFILGDSQSAVIMALMYALFFGFFFGLLRYLIFRVAEAKTP